MIVVRRIVFVVALLTLTANLFAQGVISDFATGAGGWTGVSPLGALTLTYSATGGNPNGYITARSPGSVPVGAGVLWYPFYFTAPATFTGDKSAYYSGNLRYDASQASVGTALQYPAAVMTNAAGISYYYYPPTLFQPPAFGSWTSFDVPLSATNGGWKTANASTATAATAAQVLSMLQGLETLQIQGLYQNLNVFTRIDNVKMMPPLTVTQQPVNAEVCDGQIATFKAVGGNNPTITYQWQKLNPVVGYLDISNGGGYADVTTQILSISATTTFGAGNYRCKIMGDGGVQIFSNGASLTVDALPTAPGASGSSSCGPASLTLTATGGTAGAYRWYTVSSGGTAIGGQTAATYSPGLLSTTTDYWVAIYNGTCESIRTKATITINTIPAAPSTMGSSSCGPANLTLTASGGTAGQYRWYTVSSSGTAIPGQTGATLATGSISSTVNYWVAINNGTCESTRTIVTGTINTPPTAPSTMGSSSCGPANLTLTASGGTAGQYRWYTVSSSGTAIPGQTGATLATGSISSTVNYWVAINNGTCESTRTIVTGTINTPPAAPSTMGSSSCGPANLTLTASGGTAGQYRWYTVSSSGTAIPGQTGATLATGSISSTVNYWVAINNGTCESTRTIVTGTINTPPAAPSTMGSSSCGPANLTLTASGGTAGQYRWYTVSSSGTAIPGQTAATLATGSISSTVNYWVAINNGTCESTRTMVTGTINTPPAAPTTTGASGCIPGSVVLTAAGGTNGQYRWYTVSSSGTAIVGQNNSTYSTGSLPGTKNYWVAINNGTCESTRTIVTATMNTPPAAPTTMGSSSCGPANLTLTASGGTAGQYRWYSVSSSGTAILGQTASTFATGSISSTVNYWVSIYNGTCESTRTIVTGTINTPPTAPGVIDNMGCIPDQVTLTATGATDGQYRWYTDPTGGLPIVDETAHTYRTPILSATATFYVTIHNGTCESGRVAVEATMHALPPAPTTTGDARCGPGSVVLKASGGTPGSYHWFTDPGDDPISGQHSDTFVIDDLEGTASYYVAYEDAFCASQPVEVIATINSIPDAPPAADVLGCTPSSVTFTVTGGSAGQYRWYTDQVTPNAIPGEVDATYATPELSTNTTYYVSINDGTCESARQAVTATMNNPPAAPTATGASACGPAVVELNASGASNGGYRWYIAPTGGAPIAGAVNSNFSTPSLSQTTTYYVSINNGCESDRVGVTADITPTPIAPTVAVDGDDFSCTKKAFTLIANGGSNGDYRWYTVQTGGVADGDHSGTFTTPDVGGTFYVALANGSCEGPRASITVTIGGPACETNGPPVVQGADSETVVGGTISQDLQTLISDPDNNLDWSTLSIVSQPASGAIATIDQNFNLVIDYSGVSFVGTDEITIRVCDELGSCSDGTFDIEVSGGVEVYNGVSPNKDGKNDLFILDDIDKFSDTKKNRVSIFNRWGDLVWEGNDYNNTTVVFSGLNKNNVELPTGTYYYKIEYFSGKKGLTGYFSLKR